MDGREFDLSVGHEDRGLAVKLQVSKELGIARSRLKLVAGTGVLEDNTIVRACGFSEGDPINVIVLSPLHGCLNRSNLNVPGDVLEAKMELNELLLAGVTLRKTAVAA